MTSMDECSTCSCLGINYLLKFLMQISCANSPEINKSRYHLTGVFQSQIAFMLVVLSKKLTLYRVSFEINH